MVEFKFSKDLGNSKKGEVKEMFKSTAQALVIHEIGKITKDEELKAPKKKGKAGDITTNQE